MNNQEIEKWRTSQEALEKSRRYYAHFDYRTDLARCWDYISDPARVAAHSFYPFIHYQQKFKRFVHGQRQDKVRDICYAAHIDRCIFQYYSFLLGELYNRRAAALGIDQAAVAYRNNQRGKSNIDFAAAAFRFLVNSDQAQVMVGDFSHFFDNLDHAYLKKQWCSLLEVERLPADHWAVYKNVTKYSYMELTDLLTLNSLENNREGLRQLNRRAKVLPALQLRENKGLLHKNNGVGIPQGSPISGLLANMYMLEADQRLQAQVSALGGLYMRYSDDFIIILPGLTTTEAARQFRQVAALLNSFPGLTLQPDKTQYFRYEAGRITNCGAQIDPAANAANPWLCFLGFSFDGQRVNLRDKTLSKFYYRMRKKARTIAASEGYTWKGHKISMKNLYKTYSVRGMRQGPGNFLTYARRASRGLAANRLPEDIRRRVLRRNMFKVRGFLKADYPGLHYFDNRRLGEK